MKKNAILFVIGLLAPFYLLSQRPFAPVGAKWGSVKYCQGDFFPCPPYYPLQCVFEVTQDTVIQGKYCTLIDEQDWEYSGLGNDKMIVHQDSLKIYRYDRSAEAFKLVLDFSKAIGESWKIEVPNFWYGTDSLTVSVLEKDNDFRKVSVDEIGWEFPLYEGFGGVYQNKRLMLGYEFFIHADPSIWNEMKCYIDPVEGLLFGSATGCVYSGIADMEDEKQSFSLNPNPASTQVVLDCKQPLAMAAEWSMKNVLGNSFITKQLLPGTTAFPINLENLPVGIYFWEVVVNGKEVGSGKVMVVR